MTGRETPVKFQQRNPGGPTASRQPSSTARKELGKDKANTHSHKETYDTGLDLLESLWLDRTVICGATGPVTDMRQPARFTSAPNSRHLTDLTDLT